MAACASASSRLQYGGHDDIDMAIQRRARVNDPKHLKSSARSANFEHDIDIL